MTTLMESSIPTAPVPWELAPLKGRKCATCACYFESINPQDPTKFQGFCRRQPADLQELRAMVPRIDPKTGQPVMKDGQVVMNNERVAGFLYKLTQREGICFDGYRPLGTLPGERNPFDPKWGAFLHQLVDRFGLPPGLQTDLHELVANLFPRPEAAFDPHAGDVVGAKENGG